MDKQEWISKKIAKLVREGKDQEQAAAIAYSMWEQMQKKGGMEAADAGEEPDEDEKPTGKKKQDKDEDDKNLAELSTFMPIPILRVGQTKNKGMEITKEIFSEVAGTYNPTIHEAPIVSEPHENTDAGLKEKRRDKEALGWIKKLGVIDRSGEKYLAVTELKPSSPAHEKELVRLLSGPMKNNSPELDVGAHLETEFYGKEHTGQWPDNARNKYYLRRVNLYGAQPIAQFKMPQAQLAELRLSDSGERFYSISTISKQERTMPEEKKEEPKVEEPKAETIQLSELQSRINALERRNIELAEANKNLAKDLADQKQTTRRSEISDDLEELVEEGRITKAQFDHALELACRIDADSTLLTLADENGEEKKESLYESLLFLLSNSPTALSSEPLQVINREVHSQAKNSEVIGEKEKAIKADHPDWKATRIFREAVKLAEKDSRYRKVSVYSEGGRR